ncbi:hypothetical protein RN001_008690 [Aquatica leii]|uniref:KIND domain-containing protein n=1 Tax=Aquatica leii TaxID=1421715 RepID=A0AAN7SHD2_9COLE|nr:hypothetical protein RN001_008690 [Aquatica leii]
MSSAAKCRINSDGSVCLQDILCSFNSPIREEHAWALCYQCCKFYESLIGTNNQDNYLSLLTLSHVFLQTDGNIHPNTLLDRNNEIAGCSRKKLVDEQHFVHGLGLITYQALDHGSSDGQERAISQDLEQLIFDMISERNIPEPHQETDDEGIEKDSEEEEEVVECKTVRQVIRRCEKRLIIFTKPQVEAHYKAVIHALVTEALELSTFLEKVAAKRLKIDNSSASDLDQLQFADWARFWVQVIGELRKGVKLRKVPYSRAPIEYELTPYEILMKDIRSCRYNLRKIMVDGDIPSKVTKDAHTIILDFIRSRPPLKKASDRKLPPYIRTLTSREQLLNSIRKECNPLGEATLEPYDLATRDFNYLYRTRRHTLGVIEQPWGSQSVPQSRPGSRQSCNSSEADSIPPEMTSSLQDHLAGGKCWPDGMSLEDRLSLTLEEIVHIRSVLTKAELEALPVEGRVRSDVECRKVCFLCLKTRFGIFGPWGQRCCICKRTVCFRCYSKMNVPMEHFTGVPVALLSPSLLGTPDDDRRSDSGSNRVTPDNDEDGKSTSVSDRSPSSSTMKRFKSRAAAVGKATGVVDKLKGSQLVVCHDCKMMLQQIIKSARTNRTAIRNKTLQNLSLDLSSVF